MGQPDAGLDAGYTFDSGSSDSGTADAGASDAGKRGTPWGDAGCVLPSDFPWDAGFSDSLAGSACQCVYIPQIFHCFTEDGPRCFSWACPPGRDRNDGGYLYTADGGIQCLC